MIKQSVPAYILLIALICLGVFIDAPLIPRQSKVPCYTRPTRINGSPSPPPISTKLNGYLRAMLFSELGSSLHQPALLLTPHDNKIDPKQEVSRSTKYRRSDPESPKR